MAAGEFGPVPQQVWLQQALQFRILLQALQQQPQQLVLVQPVLVWQVSVQAALAQAPQHGVVPVSQQQESAPDRGDEVRVGQNRRMQHHQL